ncbi:MFS transporter [Streptomyces lunaelactis]|uniref:MFS transporter n=1 Tax=Streptomyces lunaelactis TaxID=1535768 RepID=UPI001584F95E|nr:MFS transporter [Streptomyces lunaelactis]NUK08751.1 MFS transporter [Streptomyces lunaelactis]NUK32645.1 MFS transporter [Streptomyces lunaelactis]NUK40877.1 MFS transporter [Streptomyces lunaelactis]NUK55818.1 MFS transporter [Streptomyces lunaelactis]NUK69652.1 MFS transporter [Streptomyces lunaelactis]
MSTISESPHRAGPREWLGLAVLALPTLLLSIDVSVLHLAVPHISEGLNPSASEMLWIIDIYGFMIAGFLVAMGTLGDRIGRRKLLLIGAAAFGVASVAAAYASDPAMLIATRAALGIAGATLMPSTLALISNMFRDPKQRGVAIAVWVTMFSVGIALGPVVGGAMLEIFWWGSVFLLGVPIMALLLVAAPALLPEYRDTNAGRLDLTSVALSLAAILPVVYGLKEVAKDGLALLPVLILVAGLLVGAVFVRRQSTLTNPLLDLGLFRNRSFCTALVTLLLSMLVAGGTYLFVTQYLQLVAGLSPMKAGLYLLPAAFALIVTSVLSPVAASKIRPAYVVAVGLVVSALGHVMLSLTDSSTGVAQVVTGFALVYAGGGPLIALGTDIIVGSAPPEQAGSASAISETSTELGMALGVAALGSVGTAVYRSEVNTPPNVSEGAAQVAGDTLAGAADVAKELPVEVAAALLGSARDAFTSGMNVIGAIGALVAVGTAVLVAAVIKAPDTGADEEPSGDAALSVAPESKHAL